MDNKAIVLRAKRTMSGGKQSLCFSVPKTRLKHVACVSCKHKFHMSEKTSFIGLLVPLLLPCSHPICLGCMKNKNPTNCPLCNEPVNGNDGEKFPLNLYMLGLIAASSQYPIESNDQGFEFNQSLPVRLQQIKTQGHCYECEGPATVKCIQCMVLYCPCCYSKIHGRALQNHNQVPIVQEKENKFINITNNCSPTCNDTLSYFCNDCDMAGCSNCMLRLHKMHDYVTLQDKNEDLLADFNKVNYQLFENLQRINQTKQKLKSILFSVDETKYDDSATEKSIARHFAYLHGILQNTEARLMDQLHQWREYIKTNLTEIDAQLQTQEEQVAIALMMGSYVINNFGRVDVRNALKILKETVSLPCHLVCDDEGNEKAKFHINESIDTTIKNHCVLQVPPMMHYTLVRTDDLPKDYTIEPVTKDVAISNIFNKPQTMKQDVIPVASNPTSSSGSKKSNKKAFSYQAEVIHIVNPSLFFIRPMTTKIEFGQLENDLKIYGDNCGTNPLITIKQDDMCIVKQQDQKWYRGRVKALKHFGNEILYDIFYMDYGREENDVSTSRMQSVVGHFLKMKPLAIQCCMYGLVPKEDTWTNTNINEFMKLITEISPITIHVIKSTSDMIYVDVQIYSSRGTSSLCNIMLLTNLARSGIAQNMAPTSSTTTYPYYNKEELLLHKTTTISVKHIESPDRIYVTKKGQRHNKFKKLLTELNEYCNDTSEAKTIDTLMKGLLCAVPRLDKCWCRGEIVEILDEDRVKVFYVDIGLSSILYRNELRIIPFKFIACNAQAIRISLMFIMPEINGNWKPEAIETLKSILSDKRCITVSARKKIEDGYSGLMFANNYDVSRILKQIGVVNHPTYQKLPTKSVPNYKILLKKSDDSTKESNLSNSLEEIANNSKSVEKEETIKGPFKMEISIQQVISPDCIYVAQTGFEEANSKLMSAMQKFYDNYYSEPRNNWNEGALCMVYSMKDKSYFRAKILKMKSSTEVLVYFHDMGLEETVALKDIQDLHPKFIKEPTYCFKVKLAGILPCGGSSTWASLSLTTLSDIIQENGRCKFYISKLIEEAYDEAIPIELWVKQIKIPGPLAPSRTEINSVNRMLVDKGVALPIKNYFLKANLVLATSFKQELEDRHQLVSVSEEVKWINKICPTTIHEIDDDDILSHENHSICHSLNISESIDECNSEKRDWLPASEIVEEVFHAIPTYVDDNCVVYLHSKKNSADTLQYIESELQIYFSSAKIKKEKHWQENDLCIAQYHHNKKWYRGKVKKNLGNTLLVEFVDYGNIEECEIEHVTKDIKLTHIPIQCTKSIISGLKPDTKYGKWMLIDLDRIHALLVDKECKVCVLQRQPTHLVILITLLRPRKCEFLSYLKQYMNMSIRVEPKEWNNLENLESEDLRSNCTNKNVTIDESFDEQCVPDILDKSSLESYMLTTTFKEDVISGCSVNHTKSESESDGKEIADFEDMSWIDAIDSHDCIISSTPQNESREENFIGEYKMLTIPQETKYIELILRCNRSPTISYAQLAENNDVIFSDILHNYYLKYEAIMSDLQINANSQPLIESFEKNTPCIVKFSDDDWYRCIITHNQQIADTKDINVMLHYIDYGNNEYKRINTENHDLRTPKRDWLELPAMAIECQFSGIEFVSDDISLLAQKLDEIYNQAVVAKIKKIQKNLLVAEIYKDKECQELLYTHLINEGLYRFKKPKED